MRATNAGSTGRVWQRALTKSYDEFWGNENKIDILLYELKHSLNTNGTYHKLTHSIFAIEDQGVAYYRNQKISKIPHGDAKAFRDELKILEKNINDLSSTLFVNWF